MSIKNQVSQQFARLLALIAGRRPNPRDAKNLDHLAEGAFFPVLLLDDKVLGVGRPEVQMSFGIHRRQLEVGELRLAYVRPETGDITATTGQALVADGQIVEAALPVVGRTHPPTAKPAKPPHDGDSPRQVVAQVAGERIEATVVPAGPGDIGDVAHFHWRNTAVAVSRSGAPIDADFLSGFKVCQPSTGGDG